MARGKMAMKSVLTTGQEAKICQVAPRTVTKWFDQGMLQGFQIPGSKDRRIPVANLREFMERHHMPLDKLEEHFPPSLKVKEEVVS